MSLPQVAIVILNWNRPEDTMRCLLSAATLLNDRTAIVVVDNGSAESHWLEFEGDVRARFPECRFIAEPEVVGSELEWGGLHSVRLPKNLGYAAGNNVGLRLAIESGAHWVILLNNDCEVSLDLVDGLIGVEPPAHVGAIGCSLTTFGDPPTLLYGGGRRLYRLGAHVLTKWRRTAGRLPVNFVPFACVALSTQAVSSVGLLDERYFAYVEDSDYCFRLASAGWAMMVDLDVRVRHRVSATLGRRSYRYYYYVSRNTLMFIGERLKAPWRQVSMACFMVQALCLIGVLMTFGHRNQARAVLTGWRDYLYKRTGPMPE